MGRGEAGWGAEKNVELYKYQFKKVVRSPDHPFCVVFVCFIQFDTVLVNLTFIMLVPTPNTFNHLLFEHVRLGSWRSNNRSLQHERDLQYFFKVAFKLEYTVMYVIFIHTCHSLFCLVPILSPNSDSFCLHVRTNTYSYCGQSDTKLETELPNNPAQCGAFQRRVLAIFCLSPKWGHLIFHSLSSFVCLFTKCFILGVKRFDKILCYFQEFSFRICLIFQWLVSRYQIVSVNCTFFFFLSLCLLQFGLTSTSLSKQA